MDLKEAALADVALAEAPVTLFPIPAFCAPHPTPTHSHSLLSSLLCLVSLSTPLPPPTSCFNRRTKSVLQPVQPFAHPGHLPTLALSLGPRTHCHSTTKSASSLKQALSRCQDEEINLR